MDVYDIGMPLLWIGGVILATVVLRVVIANRNLNAWDHAPIVKPIIDTIFLTRKAPGGRLARPVRGPACQSLIVRARKRCGFWAEYAVDKVNDGISRQIRVIVKLMHTYMYMYIWRKGLYTRKR